ncbi:MAG: MBL fold metallo-hydrolase, partial [Candidatus Helarchaeota archaeon]
LLELSKKNKIKYVFNTHYHYDHIHYNYLFYRSKILMNEIEAECFLDRTNVLKRVGIYEVLGQDAIDDWLQYTKQINAKKTPYSPSRNHAWFLSTCRLNGTYRYNETWRSGNTEFQFIHTPGHSEGFCCVYFPNNDLIYTGDIDLTEFGPWYGGTDSDIDLFIASAKKIARLEIKHYATGHEVGTLSHDDFIEKLESYLKIIDNRDDKILAILEKSGPKTSDELTKLGLIYGGPKFMIDPWIWAWEKITLLKHLKRLIHKKQLVMRDFKFEII